MGSYFYFRSPILSDEHNLGSIADTVSLEVDSMISKDFVPDTARIPQKMVMESNAKTKVQESKKIKKSTIDSKKTSKKKHSAINSVKEYDKLTPIPKSSMIKEEIIRTSFNDEKY